MLNERTYGLAGRNSSEIIDRPNGHTFRKLFLGPEAHKRYLRSIRACKEVAGIPMPNILRQDEESLCIDFEGYLTCVRPTDLVEDPKRLETMSYSLGRYISILHHLENTIKDDAPWWPASDPFVALRRDTWQNANFITLESWRILQGDSTLIHSINTLRANSLSSSEKTRIHGDLRLDQILVIGDDLVITDWEEYRYSDPARDIGTFLGDWIADAIQQINENLKTTLSQSKKSDQGIVEIGETLIKQRLPYIAAFWHSYNKTYCHEERFKERVISYMGWSLISKFIGEGQYRLSLRPEAKACAGIGRNMLINPNTFLSLLDGELR